jgi:predicted DNA-binding protein (UPF0251 family)
LNELELVKLGHDELESFHLCDGKGMNQVEAGAVMGVSRGTVQRLLASARCKVAQALVQQRGLAITCMDSCDKARPCCETQSEGWK